MILNFICLKLMHVVSLRCLSAFEHVFRFLVYYLFLFVFSFLFSPLFFLARVGVFFGTGRETRAQTFPSPDTRTEFHGLSGRFSTKEGKFCEIVLARGTKEINSVARAGRRARDDDAFKAQASGVLCTHNALNARSQDVSFQIFHSANSTSENRH